MSDSDALNRRAVDRVLARWKEGETLPAWQIDDPDAPPRPTIRDDDYSWAERPERIGAVWLAPYRRSKASTARRYPLSLFVASSILLGALGGIRP